MARFDMDTLEPPDETNWQLAEEAYSASGDLTSDAQDYCATAELSAELLEAMVDEYQASSAYQTAIEDRIAGER